LSLDLLLSDCIYDDDCFGWGRINLNLRRSLLELNSLRSWINLRSMIVSHNRGRRCFLRDRFHFQVSDALRFATTDAHLIDFNN